MQQHLLIFISSLSSGGAERVTANLSNYWARKGWEVTVVTLSDVADDFYELLPSVQRIGLGLLQESTNPIIGLINNLHRVFTLRRVLRQKKPDVTLSMMNKSNILLSLAVLGFHDSVAVGSEHIHPPQTPLNRFWGTLRKYCYGNLTAVTALTSESRDWLQNHTKAKKTVVIPNAAPWPLPSQAPRLMPQYIIPPDQKLLLAVGRLSEQKGFDLLIDAFSQIAERQHNWHLAILGDGALAQSLLEQIKQAQLEHRITLAGCVGNVSDWYQAADIYVMSSRFEGFGNTLAEALTYGVPAVSFDCDCGPRDIIRHQVDGLLVPNGDVKALARSLEELMSDDTLRQKFSTEAIEARERFSIEKIAVMWENFFVELKNEQ